MRGCNNSLGGIFIANSSTNKFLTTCSTLLGSSRGLEGVFKIARDKLRFETYNLASPIYFVGARAFRSICCDHIGKGRFSRDALHKFRGFSTILSGKSVPPAFLIADSNSSINELPAVGVCGLLYKRNIGYGLRGHSGCGKGGLPRIFSIVSPFSIPNGRAVSSVLKFFSSCTGSQYG